MNLQVAQTRVASPRSRPNLVARPRLLRLVDPVVSSRLFLVIAPAGYGKTTLLADWQRQTSSRVCWYHLAPTDQDSHQFYAHFIAALQRQFADFGSHSKAALDSLLLGQGSATQLLTTVINDLYDHALEDFVLIIDDYHLVDREEEISFFVSQFVQYAPDSCHVVLSSRTLIRIPDLELLVARGDVSGIGHEDLAFRPEEIQALAKQQFNQVLDRAQAEALVEFSEGWITGLLLSAQAEAWQNSSQMRILRTSGVDLYSYFAQQVLDKQAPAVRSFLLRTSLMEDLDADLCADVFQSKDPFCGLDWSDLLQRVRRNNLFVSEHDVHHRRLRYHSLFQEFLRHRFVQEHPEEATAISQRLVAIYAERQQWEQAYENFRLVKDSAAQAAFLDEYGLSMIGSGRCQLLVRWVDELPDATKLSYGRLMAAYGKGLVLTGESEHGIQVLNQAEAILRKRNDPDTLARVLAYRSAAWRLTGRYQDSLADAEQAYELADSLESESDLQNTIAACLRSKGLALYMMGQIEQGVIWLQKSLQAYRDHKDTQETAIILMDIGLAHLNAGAYSQALALFEQALLETRQTHNLAGQANVLNNLGYLYYLRGEYQTAMVALHEGLICAQKSGYKRIEAFVLATVADMLDELDMTEAAGKIYDWSAAVAEDINERFLILYIQLAHARVAWSLNDWEAAYRYLGKVEQVVLEKDSMSEWSHYRFTIGRYYLARNMPESALAPLSDAVEYFTANGQATDAARAQLFLAAATSYGDQPAARAILEQVVRSVQSDENRHLLVVTGRTIRATLEQIAAPAKGGDAVAQFQREVDEFAASLPGLRRVAMQRLSDWLPLSVDTPPELIVRAFGKPDVFVKNELVSNSDWVGLAARDMFFCLVAHPEGLTKEQIGALFWPDCSIDQLKTRFKNTMHRMRNALPDHAIIFSDDIYRFNRRLDYEYDVEIFLAKMEEAKTTSDFARKTQLLKAAFELYRGPYLPTEEALWATSKREMLKQIYIEVGLELASLCLAAEQMSEALSYCLRILAEDPCLEEAHRLAMQIHAASGNRAAVASQYEQCRRAIETEIDAEPTLQTLRLFERLME